MCLNTKVGRGQAIPKETVLRLWDANDPLSLTNTDRFNASVRYGVAYWIAQNETAHAQIREHFGLST
jgi:hypothetical protein